MTVWQSLVISRRSLVVGSAVGLWILLGLLCVVPARSAPARATQGQDVATIGRALRERGRYAEARTRLTGARTLDARYELGLVYRATGERALERAVWNSFYDDFEAGRLDRHSARALGYLGRAAQLLGGWKDANDTFRDAVDADPTGKEGARANIAWARLFLEKYDAGHAEACLDEALKILPEDAEARTLLAAVKLEQGYDVPAAERELARAERAQAGFPEAMALRGKIALETGQRELARTLARRLLERNPAELAAHTLLAGAALLDEDRAAYEVERQAVLAVHPTQARFFHELGELLVHEHRYADAVAFEEEALRLDTKDAVARAAHGANLLRLGREEEGMRALREAWRGDKYNVRCYNLLQLFEEVIPKRYTLVEAPPFRLRVPTSERAIIVATVLPLLERARVALDAHYGTQLKGPITIELYADPSHYAVRTIGLPGLDALGVTFGPVITAMSPSLGKFNWGMVLWHELAHVYAIEASRARVPRWFTEGLSEYETTQADETWTRRTSAELAGALFRGELLPTGELDRAFLLARDLPHMVVAYHEAAAVVRYFVGRVGRAGVRTALLRYGEGRSTAEVIRETTGEELPAFDAGLRASLRANLRGYDGQLMVRPTDYSDREALEARVKVAPEDGRARGLLVLARLGAGATEAAQGLLDAPGHQPSLEMRYAQVRLALGKRSLDAARDALVALRATGARGADVELLAARVHKARGETEAAWSALVQAGLADPDRSEPHLLMAELAQANPHPQACGQDAPGGAACAMSALERALPLEVMDASIGRRLFKLRRTAGRADALAAAQRALAIAPFDGELRLDLAEVAPSPNEAQRELTLARACPLSKEAAARADALEGRLRPRRAPAQSR